MNLKRVASALGPGFITAAVVIGPGSVTVMTATGSTYGYQLLWLPLVVGVLMAAFTVLFMRFGVMSERTFFDVVAARGGRPLAVLCGFSAFYIAAAFQFGNNIGIATAMQGLLPDAPTWVWPIAFNGASILFLFVFRRTYFYLEKMMLVMVGGMLLAFLANLFFAGIDAPKAAAGLVVRIPANADWMKLGGLIATTFSILAAINQAYLVRAKGWGRDNFAEGRTDALAGIAMLAAISMIVMMTSAAVLQKSGIQVNNAADMAKQLQTLFGSHARVIFCLGLAAAAFSSFIMNAMIGGVLFSDSMGKSARIDDAMPKVLGTLALLAGMVVALLVLTVEGISFVKCLIAAQAGTLLAVPLAAVCSWMVLFWKDSTPEQPLGIGARVWVAIGVLVLFATSTMTAVKLFGS